jgi:protein-S-isoprenylcysteine O-methyltransferase Ste14
MPAQSKKEATMHEQLTAAVPEHSEVIIFPPVIPATGFLLGVVVNWMLAADRWLTAPLRIGARAVGGVVFALGVAGLAWMVVTMKRARTPIHNARTPSRLVESGPFRWSRNPMYLFGSVWYAGLALLLLQPWSLALLPAVVLATHYGVVLKEEEFLERRFGESYRRYKARVRRW